MASSDEKPASPSERRFTSEPPHVLKEFADKVSATLGDLGLNEGTSQELKSHIEVVHAELDSDEPDHTLIDDALAAMHRVLESSTTRKAAELLAEAGRFLTGVG